MSTDQASAPRFAIEQKLRQMNDDWLKALVRADRETLDRIMPMISYSRTRWRATTRHIHR